MRVLVTGGAGFIGSAVSRRLIAEKHEVTVVDDLSTGQRANIPIGATFIEADVAHRNGLSGVPASRYDAIVHLAAQSSGAIGQADPYADMLTNIGATVLVSRWAIARGVSRFLFPSSMTVYGHGNREPVEEAVSCAPISYYGAAKAASENYLRIAALEGLQSTCLRLYNVYGRGQNLANLYQGMVSIYLAYLLQGVSVPVTGSFERYRDFVHIDDVVEAVMLTLARPKAPSFIYNIGSGQRTTVKEIIQMLIAAVGLPIGHPVEEMKGSVNDVFGSVADTARARDELGWRPRVELKTGIEDMVRWAKDAQPLLAAERTAYRR